MLSKNKLKYLRQLALKKHRDEFGVFLAEGPKVVGDLLPYFHCQMLCATTEYLAQHPTLSADEIIEVSQRELEQASQLKTPRDVLAVFSRPEAAHADELLTLSQTQLVLALDGVQDPGNVGTIVRIADWFGIEHIFCSVDTADVFSPKTVQATMGAIGRVKVHYGPLPQQLRELPESVKVMGTFLDGENLYDKQLPQTGILVMGNEGKGISPEVEAAVNERLFIPNFPADRPTSESLNVAIATAIVCGEFRRRVNVPSSSSSC